MRNALDSTAPTLLNNSVTTTSLEARSPSNRLANPPSQLSDSDITAAPKIDLHRHLLGSARPETLWDLSRKYNWTQGPGTQEELTASIVRSRAPGDVSRYFEPWSLLREVIRSPEDVKRIASEAAIDARADGMVYVEFRSSLPGMIITDGAAPQTRIPTHEYLHAIADGFEEVSNITCRLVASLPRHVVGAATPKTREKYSNDFFRAVSGFRRTLIVGVDLTGVERGWPARLFADIFAEASRVALPVTIHAGETEGPDEVWSAIEELGAVRIGHGTSACLDPRLVQAIIDRGVVLEVCPTSSWLTGAVNDPAVHPIIQHYPRIPYVIATDNPTLNATTLSNELRLAARIAKEPLDFFIQGQFETACRAVFAPESITAGVVQA